MDIPSLLLPDKSREQEVLDQYFCERIVDALMTPEAPFRDFFFRYLTTAFSIPIGIYHFAVAGDFFERKYLCRLKERNETFSCAGRCSTSAWRRSSSPEN